MRKLACIAAIPAMMILGTSANADATVQFRVTNAADPKSASTQIVYIQQDKLMVRNVGGQSGIDMLFSKKDDTMTIINHQQKSYVVVDEERIAQLAGQAQGLLDAIQQQLEKQMKEMPPEKQARMREMMEKYGMKDPNAPPPPPRTIKRLGNRAINGFKCRQVEVYKGPAKMSELCVADASALGLPAADYATIQAMQGFGERLSSHTARLSGKLSQQMPDFGGRELGGVPVEMKDLLNEDRTVMTVTAVNKGIGTVRIAVPNDYKPQALPSIPNIRIRSRSAN